MNTATMRRLGAMGRAELILLLRNRQALFVALALPVLMMVTMRRTVGQMDLSHTGLSLGTVLVPGAIGYVLLFAVYSTVMSVFVTRREELVLKRLRTGESRDAEILLGSSLPSLVIGLAQCVLMLAGGAVLLHLTAPARPDLVVLGLVLGLPMMVSVAAACATLAKTSETSQLIAMPLLLVSLAGSGILIPLEILPGQIADVCQFLPLSPVMQLVRGGWTGGLGAPEVLRQVGVALAWTGLAVFAVRRWFRWEPRQ